jgi:lipoate-protein ligase B
MLQIRYLGRTPYSDALALQRQLHLERVLGEIEDLVLITEHEPVITLGRNADRRNVLASAETLKELGTALVSSERGGDVTYHCPGQVVVYPIVDIRECRLGVRDYIRVLEEVAIGLVGLYGIDGERLDGLPGVWVDDRKIASVGVYISHWVTMHGIAINVDPDLAGFDLIRPCGITGVQMTSLAQLCNPPPSMAEAAQHIARLFTECLGHAALGKVKHVNGEDLAPNPTAPSGLSGA